jgi:hypothetical protein
MSLKKKKNNHMNALNAVQTYTKEREKKKYIEIESTFD